MTDQRKQVGGGRRSTGDVLFDDVRNRPGLAARDRSLITVAVAK